MHKADNKENSKEAIYNIKTHLNNIFNLSRASVLASNPEKRGKYEELAIKCGY